jgi:hypothetical protein
MAGLETVVSPAQDVDVDVDVDAVAGRIRKRAGSYRRAAARQLGPVVTQPENRQQTMARKSSVLSPIKTGATDGSRVRRILKIRLHGLVAFAEKGRNVEIGLLEVGNHGLTHGAVPHGIEA